MVADFQRDRPIYQQLMDRLISEIIRGERKPGDKLPSVRDYSLSTGVNPNTMSRTYRELEQLGVVETRRGQGTFVTEDDERLQNLRENLKIKYIESFVQDMKELGFTVGEMVEGLNGMKREEE